MADFGGDLDAFRAEARAWLEANFPPSLKGKSAMAYDRGRQSRPTPTIKAWTQGAWARRAGARRPGRRNTAAAASRRAEARVLQQEMNRIGAWNPIGGMGMMMFGPTLLEYGTEEQKQQHIPPSCKGELRWCQGYSEPGAGSDLASPADQGRGQGRPLAGQRPEDLDLAARSSPTGASAWCAPTPPRSTRASASC